MERGVLGVDLQLLQLNCHVLQVREFVPGVVLQSGVLLERRTGEWKTFQNKRNKDRASDAMGKYPWKRSVQSGGDLYTSENDRERQILSSRKRNTTERGQITFERKIDRERDPER